MASLLSASDKRTGAMAGRAMANLVMAQIDHRYAYAPVSALAADTPYNYTMIGRTAPIAGQHYLGWRLSDQSSGDKAWETSTVQQVLEVEEHHGATTYLIETRNSVIKVLVILR